MISIILILFSVFCLLLRYYLKNDESDTYLDQIPGPKGIPFIGNIEDLFCKEEDRWRRMRARAIEYYPIYKMKVLGKRTVHLLDPVDVEAILGNPKYISKGRIYKPVRDWLGNGILMSSGETWRRSRKLLTKSFHFGALKNYVHSINDATDYLTSLFETEIGKPLDLSPFCNFMPFKIACEILLGKRIDIRDNSVKLFTQSIKDMTSITILKLMVPLMSCLYKYTHLKKKEDKAMKIYWDFITNVMEGSQRNNENGDQPRFLNILVKNFDDASLKNELSTFLFAGQDTTSIALKFFLYILGNKPQFQKNHSMKDEVTGFVSKMYKAANKSKPALCFFLYLTEMFGTVDGKQLLESLHHIWDVEELFTSCYIPTFQILTRLSERIVKLDVRNAPGHCSGTTDYIVYVNNLLTSYTNGSILSFTEPSLLTVYVAKLKQKEEIYKEIIQTSGIKGPTYAEIKQMNFLDRFIKECFRLYPTAHFIGRTLDVAFQTPSGYTLPAGTDVFIPIFDIHRNDEIYPNPHIFDPDRFLPEHLQKRHPYSFIPFSAGPRNCIAQKFAVLEIKATICGILKKYKIEALGALEDIILIPDLLLKAKSPLKVKFIPR